MLVRTIGAELLRRIAIVIAALALCLVPVAVGIGMLALGQPFGLALGAGVGTGVLLAIVWAGLLGRFALVFLAIPSGLVAPTCGASMGPQVRVVIQGVPELTVPQAAEGAHETIQFAHSVAGRDSLLIASRKLKNVRSGMDHQTFFFAPMTPLEGEAKPTKVWLACYRSVSVENSQPECYQALSASPLFARLKPAFREELVTVAKQKRVEIAPSPRVYEVMDDPTGEVWSDGAFVALVWLLGAVCVLGPIVVALRGKD